MFAQFAACFLFWLSAVVAVPGQAAYPRSNNPSNVTPEVASDSASRTVPAGTVLYLGMMTPVSTKTSHLNEGIRAEVERAVITAGTVDIPVRAVVSGQVAKLIPSSSPTDRAKLLLRFDSITLPGQSPVSLFAHVKEVDNARESVLPDGTIVGLLQSELPITLLNSAVEKMGKKNSGTAQPSKNSNSESSRLDQGDTSITYPQGTEFALVLDKPLTVRGVYQPEFEHQVSALLAESVTQLLEHSPRRVSSKKGVQGGAVNIVVIGGNKEISAAFEKAGWTEAAEQNSTSLWKTAQAVVRGRGYDAAPMSTLYLYGRPEDMAFEKLLNTFAMRHHLRMWRASATAPDGRLIWLVSADHDNGVDIHPGVISHATDPHVDAERDKVGADLGMTGLVAAEQLVLPPNPLRSGTTATGGQWETDGRVLVIDLKPPAH